MPTGIESFKWFPDGRHIAFAAWVWPELKHAAQGARMQVERERKDSAYVTDDTLYRWWDHNLPQGARCTCMCSTPPPAACATSSKARRSNSAAWTQRRCLRHRPDGRRLVFAFDPAAEPACENRFALAEIEVRSRQHRVLLQDNDWHFDAPRYSHSGRYLAFLASHQGLRHTAPNQLGVLDGHGHWAICGAAWDRDIAARCIGHLKTTPSSLPPKTMAAATSGRCSCPAARWTACAVAATSAPLTCRPRPASSSMTACTTHLASRC